MRTRLSRNSSGWALLIRQRMDGSEESCATRVERIRRKHEATICMIEEDTQGLSRFEKMTVNMCFVFGQKEMAAVRNRAAGAQAEGFSQDLTKE